MLRRKKRSHCLNYMQNVLRKIIEIDFSDKIKALFPDFASKSLDVLESENDIVIKGGLTRLCLIGELMLQRKFDDKKRLAVEHYIKDLDIIMLHKNSLSKDRDRMIARFSELQNLLKKEGIDLHGEDVEPLKGDLRDKSTFLHILATRDFTINEVILARADNKWKLFFTPQCWRDIAQGIGFLNPKPGMIRYDWGRILPSNLGWARLLKFLAEMKVNSVYIPAWWAQVHLQEAERQIGQGFLPKGGIMGLYAPLMIEKYAVNNSAVQRRLMKILNSLGFADIRDPGEYLEYQKSIFAEQGKEFSLKVFSFIDGLDHEIERANQREEGRKNRNAQRKICEHEWKNLECHGCPSNCLLKSCAKCNHVATTDLPCNTRMKNADWPADRASLWKPVF